MILIICIIMPSKNSKIEAKNWKIHFFDDNHIMMQYNIFSKQDILFRVHIDTADNRHEIYVCPHTPKFSRRIRLVLHIFNLITISFTEVIPMPHFPPDIISTNNYDVLRYLSRLFLLYNLQTSWELNRNSIPTMVHQSKWL